MFTLKSSGFVLLCSVELFAQQADVKKQEVQKTEKAIAACEANKEAHMRQIVRKRYGQTMTQLIDLRAAMSVDCTGNHPTPATMDEADKKSVELRQEAQLQMMQQQIREQDELVERQTAVIQQQGELASQQAETLAMQKGVTATQANIINRQAVTAIAQAKSIEFTGKGLFVAAGLVVLCAALLAVYGFTIRKKLALAQPTEVEHLKSMLSIVPSALPIGPKITPDTLVNPNRENLLNDKGEAREYVLRLDEGATFRCLAIFKSPADKWPLTSFLDFPFVTPVKWEARLQAAAKLMSNRKSLVS